MYRGKLRGYIVSLVNFNTSYMSSGLFNQSLYTTSFNFTPNSQTSLASYNFTNFTNKLLNSLNNINLNFRTEAKSGVNKTLSTSSANSNKSETLEKADYNAKAGKRLADIAAKNTVGFTKQCATYVKRAIDNAGLGKYEYGDAYECANILKRNPNFKEITELLFPAVLSSTVGQIHIYVDMFFTSSISEGAWTAIGYANRVFQFPVGILVTAFLVPLFPIFSRLVAEKDLDGIKTYFNKGVGVLFFAAIPIIIGILTVGMDAVRLIFERGAFDETATFMVTEALWFLSVSILPYVFRDSITRVYYSFNDSKTPFIVAFSSIVLKYLLNVIFISKMHMGIGGITLSTSLVTLFNACVLGSLIYKKVRMDYKSLFTNLLKMAIAGIISLVVCFGLAYGFDKFVHMPKALFEIIKIALVGIVCLVSYTGLNLIFKMEYANELAQRFMRKINAGK